MSDESDDDAPRLSANTLLALQEFYQEQNTRDEQVNVLKTNPAGADNLVFEEDWQLSQFWYDEKTVDVLIRGAIESARPNGKIALISCPTLYKKLKLHAEGYEVTLFEYDRRFAVFGSDFQFYDYKSPLDIPRELSNQFDIVLADPPFLSEECLTKTAVTAKFLTRNKIVLCTGAVMQDLAKRLLNVNKCKFEPHHKNNLANEFWCFSNFDFDSLIDDR